MRKQINFISMCLHECNRVGYIPTFFIPIFHILRLS